MKFQNPSLIFFLKGRKDARTHAQAETNMLPTFSKLGAQKRGEFRCRGLYLTQNHLKMEKKTKKEEKKRKKKICVRSGI